MKADNKTFDESTSIGLFQVQKVMVFIVNLEYFRIYIQLDNFDFLNFIDPA